MAPEQLAGDAVGPQADQFAFCVVLFEALTGRRPFAGDTPQALLSAIAARAIDPALARLPRGLRALLRTGLDPEPSRRHRDMREVVDRLAAIGSRRRTVGIAAATAAAALAIAAAVLGRDPSPSAPAVAPPDTPVITDGRDAAAQAVLAAARAHATAGEFAAAQAALEGLHGQAVATDAWATAADAATELVRVVGFHGEDLDGGLRWHRHATAALQRRGDDPDRLARLFDAMGSVHLAAGAFALAQEHFAAGLALCRAQYGDDDPRTAIARSQLATAETKLGHVDHAIAEHERALAQLDAADHRTARAQVLVALANAQAEGKRHHDARRSLEQARALLDAGDGPLLGRVASNLAAELTAVGDYDAAAAALDDAETLLGRAYGPEHPNVASVIVGRANLRAIAGDFAGARTGFERALGIKERAFGHDHPALLPIVEDLAQIARVTGDRISCQRHQERAVQLAEAHYGRDHLELAAALEDLGNTLASNEEAAAAMRVLEQALAIRLRHVDPDDPSLSNNWLAQAKVHIAAEDWPATDTALARALALAPAPAQQAAIVLTQAESLWRRGREREAVRAARRARALVDDRPEQGGLLAAVDDWFAAHGRSAGPTAAGVTRGR